MQDYINALSGGLQDEDATEASFASRKLRLQLVREVLRLALLEALPADLAASHVSAVVPALSSCAARVCVEDVLEGLESGTAGRPLEMLLEVLPQLLGAVKEGKQGEAAGLCREAAGASYHKNA